MPKKKYAPNAKKRILDQAVDIFAQNGFNGSRVDQIAKAANVPKSLIYYHFKSKDAILDELIKNCMDQYSSIIDEVAQKSGSNDTQVLLNRIRTVYWKFLEDNEDIIRVISMESLKKNSPKAGIAFKFAELLIGIERDYIRQTVDMSRDEQNEHLVAEFFTGQIPVVIFFCLRHTFSDSFQVEPDKLSRHFFKAYNETYGEYRRKRIK